MFWLIQFSAVCSLAWFAGTFIGRRVAAKGGARPSKAFIPAALFVVGWFSLSWWARQYGDTDKMGWQWAEAWALTWKWYLLLGGTLFAVRFASQLEPKKTWLLPVTYVLLVGVAGWRTMPVYLLVGEDRRDAAGYLRQSQGLQSTCGGVALANYLEQFHKHRVSEREISRAARTTSEGSTTANLLRAAREFGLTNATARALS